MRTGVKERIRQIALQVLNDDVYALQDTYSNEQLADLVTSIIVHFKFHSTMPCIRTFEGELLIKVKNTLTGSEVSVSNSENGTGVSRSLAYVVELQSEEKEEEVKEMIEMLDEAYCLMLDYVV